MGRPQSAREALLHSPYRLLPQPAPYTMLGAQLQEAASLPA